MTAYPSLDPEPLIPWGPGSARERHTDGWDPSDVALQLEEHYD